MSDDLFDVEITKDHKLYYLSITKNGYQWSTLTFETLDQLRVVANKIQEALIDDALYNLRKIKED